MIVTGGCNDRCAVATHEYGCGWVLTGGTAAKPDPAATSERAGTLAELAVERLNALQGYCGWCTPFCANPSAHSFLESIFLRPNTGLYHACFQAETGGWCPHPICDDQLGDATQQTREQRLARELATIVAMIHSGDQGASSRIERLLLEYPNRVQVVAERTALQVRSPCSPDLVAWHMPLPLEVVAASGSVALLRDVATRVQ